MLSALAGGGLTAAGLGTPFVGVALGAEAPTGSPASGEGSAATPTTTSTATPTATSAPVAAPAVGTTGQTTTSTPTSTQAPSPASTPASGDAPEVPKVVLQRRQKTTPSKRASSNLSATAPKSQSAQPTTGGANASKGGASSGPNNVAQPPQLVAAQAKALAAELAGSAASAQALAFYRIPLFLLPIYQAAAVQYGVPWQILAAINEIETDYGSDQSVSTAGAVGWMQFEPSTWLQYGVDAQDAGYADPYNPVDAIFAAARYLRAAGAESNLRGAILAYNHSEEYADSVLLRAKLISTYPKTVIATLTGLIDARLPVAGKQVSWGALLAAFSPSSATANAAAVPGAAPAGAGDAAQPAVSGTSASGSRAAGSTAKPGASAAISPAAAAALATGKAAASAQAAQFVDVMSAPNVAVVAVQDGRIVQLGSSHKLGKYLVLRDVYGDLFTYAGLGSVAPRYRRPKAAAVAAKAPAAQAASARDPKPAQSASAGSQAPLTLQVKTPAAKSPTAKSPAAKATAAKTPGVAPSAAPAEAAAPAETGKVRLFAHPGNPDALAAAARNASQTPLPGAGAELPLRRGSIVTQGTVLGRVRVPLGAKDGHLRFAIRPAGDSQTVDPRTILENWKQLDIALHPQGAKHDRGLLGATASDVFLLSKRDLQREILSDPGIVMPSCARHEVAAGAIDKRVLAVLGFLSRSDLKPTVGTLRCGGGAYAASDFVPKDHSGDGLAISQINGVPVAGHQGAGSITDTTIRTLLTLRGEFVPHKIVSLMHYPGAASTLARADHGAYIEIVFAPSVKRADVSKDAAKQATAARSAGTGQTAPAPLVASGDLSAAQWDRLIARIAALPAPTVKAKPSSSAIPDRTDSSQPKSP
jgi:Transglycosylase SLT domain